MPTHDDYTRRILDEIGSGRPVTQRRLSRELGIALGLTNLLFRRLVSKGYVRIANINPRRVRYYLTPTGIAEKARMSKAFLDNTVRLYTETRERIRASFDRLSKSWPDSFDGDGEKRVVFYGAGDVAEIAYVSIQDSDIRLVGVVDDFKRKKFFGMLVRPPADLTAEGLGGEPFGCVVIMSFRKADQIQARLDAMGFPRRRTVLLEGADTTAGEEIARSHNDVAV